MSRSTAPTVAALAAALACSTSTPRRSDAFTTTVAPGGGAADLAAAARLEAALEVRSLSDDERLELAEELLADGRSPDQAAALLRGVARRDGNARFHVLSGRLAELCGDDAGAAGAYGRALAFAEDPDQRLRRGLALERLGRREEAIEELERVRGGRPGDAVVASRLADLYESAGRLREAELELRGLASARPERAAAWERLARFYERVGRRSEARTATSRARDLSGRTARALRPLLPSRL